MRPDKAHFMDTDMLRLWNRMSPADLPDYRLYGGTALALYLNHRESTAFDFFRDKAVFRADLIDIPWLKDARFRGQRRMVDAVVPGTDRNVTINFIHLHDFGALPPTEAAVTAKNGMAIAHPTDILANKLMALSQRKLGRDFFDIAYAHLAMPAQLIEAVNIYLNSHAALNSEPPELAKTLVNYPFDVEYALPKNLLHSLSDLANRLTDFKSVEHLSRHLSKTKRNRDYEQEP